jgi:DNA-binding transcriptional ArsR family regulator
MEVIAEIRRRHLVSGESISSIARDLKLSRPTVRKHLQTESEAVYLREHQPAPKLGEFQSVLESWLKPSASSPRRNDALPSGSLKACRPRATEVPTTACNAS